ncbi:MAG: F0F1 ATP synthase subunit alpha, partial [Woeseiaceae bacterium]|nr:F0F1 ATP synthase subunit alpha [Woeseiaceae bacterium]
LMKQKQYSPLSVAEMGLSLYAVNEGYLDDVAVEKVVDYEAALHDFARANNQDTLDSINASGDYNDDIVASLTGICDEFAEKGAY